MAHITIPDEDPDVSYTLGAPSSGPFAIPFPFFALTDIKVYKNGTLLTVTTHYTLSGTAVEGGYDGGEITLVSAGATSDVIYIVRDQAIERTSDFPDAGKFNISTLNTTLDRYIGLMQQLNRLAARSLHLVDSAQNPGVELPEDRASAYLGFDANKVPVALAAPASTTALSVFSAALVLLTTEAAWRTGISAVGDADLRALLFGCELSRPSATTITFGAGVAMEAGSTELIRFTAAMTKTLQAAGAWTAGNNQNGLFTGARANSTWYHCFVMLKTADGTVDAGFDTDVGGANKPVGYVVRRVGSVLTDGSGNILDFLQDDDRFYWKAPVLDINGAATSAAWTALALTVPLGVRVSAFGSGQSGDGATATSSGFLGLRATDASDTNPATDIGTAVANGFASSTDEVAFAWGPVLVNTARQLQYYATAAAPRLYLRTRGWIDRRGK